jgi:hypothetical protein
MGATYMECSAKERIGIEDIFDSAIVLATAEEDGTGDELMIVQNGLVKPVGKKRRKLKRNCRML